MKKIITTVLDLSEIFEGLTLAETFKLAKEIKNSKEKLERLKIKIIRDISNDLYVSTEILDDTIIQLHYVNLNLVVLENVLLCHESKIFENRTFNGLKFKVSLN